MRSRTGSVGWWRWLGTRDYAHVWSASTVSYLGTAVTRVALPLVALVTLEASTLELGVISAAGVISWLVLGLSAGVWIDRLRRRPVLITCDLVCAVALAWVPIASRLHILTISQLIVVAFVIGTGAVFFDIASQTYLPSIVPADQLLAANSKLQASSATAQTAGPVLGGGLVQLLGAPLAIIADVASYVVSALLLWTVRTPEPPVERSTERRMLPLIRAGLTYVWREPVLRPLMVLAASLNLLAMALDTLTIPFLLRTLHITPALIGVLLALGGVGAVLGAIGGPTVANRIGSARALLVAAVAGPLLSLLVPLSVSGAGLVLFGVGFFSREACLTCISLLARSYRQLVTPSELLGRVTATIKFVSWGVLPIGALVGGALGQWLGNRVGLWVVCGLLMLTPLSVLLSSLRHRPELLGETRSGSDGQSSAGSTPDDPATAGPATRQQVSTETAN